MSSPQVLLSHPGNGPFVQHAARSLLEAEALNAYVTTFVYQKERLSARVLNLGLRPFFSDPEAQLARRTITEVPDEKLIQHPLPNFIQTAARMLPISLIARDRVWERMELWFDRIVAQRHLTDGLAVYSYEHCCLETFKACKALGGLCLYDMPCAHHATPRKWLQAELEKFPELETDYLRHLKREAFRRNQRKDQELELADRVIAGSQFVADSVVDAGFPREHVWIVPSGAPPVDTSNRSGDSSRCIFVAAGSLSVHKGIHLLLDAWTRWNPPDECELWLVGKWRLPESARQGLPGRVTFTETVPRPQLYEMFDQAQILVLPTFSEGLPLTPLQAMSRGMCVITTPNSGLDTFIRSSENGWLVPPGNVVALEAAMRDAFRRRRELTAMGLQASEAMKRWQWEHYRAALGRKVTAFLEQQCEVAAGRVKRGQQ